MSTAFPKNFKSFFGIVFSLILAFQSIIQGYKADCGTEMPVIPDDFTPIVQFAVCSDIHNANERFADMMDTCYELAAENEAYSKLDAVLIAGDFTNVATVEELQAFKDTVDESVREGTKTIICLGNHEGRSKTIYDDFESVFGMECNTDTEINGVHFIAVSYINGSGTLYSPKTKKWVKSCLESAEAENPSMPIIVIQHPHPFSTVYGSDSWGSLELNYLWNQYEQVINFSGNSHFPINDPRSIWQGGYTALGCGTLKYFELELDLVARQHPEGNDKAAQFYLVSVDANGSTAIKCYDLITHRFFGEEYYIETPSDKSTFAYTYKNRLEYDEIPEFAQDAQITVSTDEETGNYLVNFPAASDKLIVHDYKISVKTEAGISVFSSSLLSGYYFADSPSSYSVDVGALKSGKTYVVSVTAVNAYYECSQALTYEFTA